MEHFYSILIVAIGHLQNEHNDHHCLLIAIASWGQFVQRVSARFRACNALLLLLTLDQWLLLLLLLLMLMMMMLLSFDGNVTVAYT